MDVNGQRYEVGYWPGDSRSGMFGGNSNWRGPICESRLFLSAINPVFNLLGDSFLGLATNFLLIESLQRFYQYYGDDLQVRASEKCLPVAVINVRSGGMPNWKW